MISATTSPVEIIASNRYIEHLLNRYQISIYSTNPIKQQIEKTDFLVELLNVYSGNKKFDSNDFEKFSVIEILDYLQRSHVYYIEKRIPEIGQSIFNIIKQKGENLKLMKELLDFLCFFRLDLKLHFEYEEKYLFPYSRLLYNTSLLPESISEAKAYLSMYSVKEFKENHPNSELELTELIPSLEKHNNGKKAFDPLGILIRQLKNFENDLSIHAFIEDEVLIPKLEFLEHKLNL